MDSTKVRRPRGERKSNSPIWASTRNWPKTDNMAYAYGDMSGKVATDLSEWDEWLKTQNVYYLEQLAKTTLAIRI